MAGNVAEWTDTPYDESTYIMQSGLKPKDRTVVSNPLRVVRGGSWRDPGYFLQVATRDKEMADSARCYIGFRTVVSAPGPGLLNESNAPQSGRNVK